MMSLESDIFAIFAPLVDNRCYPVEFPQAPDRPTWPAIRYSVVSAVPPATVCGSGVPERADTRVQVDVVAETFEASRALRDAVLAALDELSPPALWESPFDEYDAETKTFRCSVDLIFYPSGA